MREGFIIQQPQFLVEENISNLTSASNEAASVSSVNRNDSESMYPHHYSSAPPTQGTSQPPKRKRNLPGNPDPGAEVVALSPKSLLATNRFVCEICGKGFQRDQNLQLHRRGHNLPWKLKQRSSKEARKKVYVCPEASCVHHNPSRALGDLTGIKKHFCRKHGEKKWKCEKCSKRYAVQSDWKAHSKTCGTREYRCDCGTLFSRRDSFITHRAFCNALAEENARTITGNPHLSSSEAGFSAPQNVNIQFYQPQFNCIHDPLYMFPSIKKEQQIFTLSPPEIPPWLAGHDLSSSILPSKVNQEFQENGSPRMMGLTPALPPYLSPTSPCMSATALLQKAAQMGATTTSSSSSKTSSSPAIMLRPYRAHVSAESDSAAGAGGTGGGPPSFVQDMMMMMTSLASSSAATGFHESGFEEASGRMLTVNKDEENHNFYETTFSKSASTLGLGGGMKTNHDARYAKGGMTTTTRDFLGLWPLSQSNLFIKYC